MSGNAGGEPPPPWQTGESGEEGPVDADVVDVKGEAFEESAPPVAYSAEYARERDLSLIKSADGAPTNAA
eukprot:12558006-Alexandrium_andersonii.AAC.1